METFLGIMIPFLGTALGAACVFFMKKSLGDLVQRSLAGFAAGVMVAASIWSLLIPAIEQSEGMGKLSFLPAFIGFWVGVLFLLLLGNVKKCAVGKHPKSEKHGNTAQFSEVERSGTQENCGGIGSGCRLRLRPLPVLRRRQSQRVARIDPNAVVVDKNIAENDRFDLFSR